MRTADSLPLSHFFSRSLSLSDYSVFFLLEPSTLFVHTTRDPWYIEPTSKKINFSKSSFPLGELRSLYRLLFALSATQSSLTPFTSHSPLWKLRAITFRPLTYAFFLKNYNYSSWNKYDVVVQCANVRS